MAPSNISAPPPNCPELGSIHRDLGNALMRADKPKLR
jgi:hypothetical protein